MASAVIGALRVNLSIDAASFHKGVSSAEARLAAFGRKLAPVAKNVLAVGAAATAAGAALVTALVVKQMGVIDAQAKLAARLGTSVTAIQTLQHAGELAGVSAETLAKALGMLNARLGEAERTGAGPAYEAIQRLGLSVRALSEMDADERIKALAVRMEELGYTAQQRADTLRQFGIRGQEMLNLFIEGSPAIDRARKDLEAWGVALSDVDAKKVEAANDALERIRTVLAGIGNQIAVRIAPLIEHLATWLTEAAKQSGGFGTAIDAALRVAITIFARLNEEVYRFRVEFDETIAMILKGFRAVAGVVPGLGVALDVLRIQEGWGELRNNLAKPPSAEEWIAWFDTITAKSEEAAQMAATFGAADALKALGIGTSDDTTETERDEAARRAEQLAERVAQLQESLLSEREAELNAYAQRMTDLNDFYAGKAELQSEYDEFAAAAAADHAEKLKKIDDEVTENARRNAEAKRAVLFDVAGSIADSLGTLFGKSKMFAYASAIINVAEGVTKALAQGGWLGFAQAAAVATAGAAQIATIARTKPGSGGSVPSVSGGGSSGAGAAGQGSSGGVLAGQTMTVKGLTPTQIFSGDGLREFVDTLLQYQRDGGRVVLA